MLQDSSDKEDKQKPKNMRECENFSATSNTFRFSVEGQGAMVMAKDVKMITVTKCPTYSDLFERFNQGLHKYCYHLP
jgi:hypothetical protein